MTILRFKRIEKGFSTKSLAEHICFSRVYVGQLERGQVKPQKIGKRLRRDLENLFGASLERLLQPVPPPQ